VARRAIAGLERGEHFVAVSFLGTLMRCGAIGASQRNSWVFDTVLGWFMPLIYFVVLRMMNSQVRGWTKTHGNPAAKGTKAT
jgi:3-dehydrosphinganine reductase